MHIEREGAGTGRGARLPSPRRLALFSLLAALSVGAAWSQPTAFDYAPGKVTINAAVISLEGIPNRNRGTSRTTDPGIMESLRRASLRPSRWDIVNPAGLTGPVPVYIHEGDPINYWGRTLLDAAHTDLSGYDLLYVATADLTDINDYHANSLLEAVNEGAVLWIDCDGGTGGTAWPFGVGITAGTSTVTDPAQHNLALVSRPFMLHNNTDAAEEDDLSLLGLGAGDVADVLDISANAAYLQSLLVYDDGTPANLEVLAAAGRYGSGGFVVTTGDVGGDIAAWGASGTANPRSWEVPDFKLAYNIMAWATGWSQSRQSPRGAGASKGEVRADLDVKWQTGNIGPVAAAPVVDDTGRLFVLTYGGSAGLVPALRCYDSDPAQDIDGDSYVDDGVADYRGADSPDLIWQVDFDGLTPRSTSPTAATTAAGDDVVLVSVCNTNDEDAEVRCYNALDGTDVWANAYDVLSYNDDAWVRSLSTPVVHNGFVYVLASECDDSAPGDPADQTYGRVHCFDLETAATYTWEYPRFVTGLDANRQLQHRMSLPPFDDPEWLVDIDTELPPEPTPVPSVCNGPRFKAQEPNTPDTFDPHLDAVLYCGTPVSKLWTPATSAMETVPWGCDYALVPQPSDEAATPDYPLDRNELYYRVLLDVQPATAVNGSEFALESEHGEASVATPTAVWAVGNPQYATFDPWAVEDALAELPDQDIPDTSGNYDTTCADVQTGCDISISYTDGTDDFQDIDLLPGPVVFRRPHREATFVDSGSGYWPYTGRRRTTGSAINADVLTAALTPMLGQDNTASCYTPGVPGDPDADPPIPDIPPSWMVDYAFPGHSGAVVGIDPETGKLKWLFDPRAGSGGNATVGGAVVRGPGARVFVDAAPADAGSTIIGAASSEIDVPPSATDYPLWPDINFDPTANRATDAGNLGRVFALNSRPNTTVRPRFGGGTPLDPENQLGAPFNVFDHTPIVQLVPDLPSGVTLDWDADELAALPVIDPTCYTVDYDSRRITFKPETAHNVIAYTGVGTGGFAAGAALGPVHGRMLVLSYTYDDDLDRSTPGTSVTGEVCRVPDLVRWEYTPGVIRLRYHPVLLTAPPVATLPNGVGVNLNLGTGGFAEGTVTINGLTWLPTGLINCDAATWGSDAARVQRGADMYFRYSGMSLDDSGGTIGVLTIPNAYEGTERHQVPYSFGRPVAPITVANDGETILVGTEAFDPGQSGAPTPGPDVEAYAVGQTSAAWAAREVDQTLLALAWNKLTDYVRGVLVRPAYQDPTAGGVTVISNAPAVEGDTAFVGSRTMPRVANHWTSEGYAGPPSAAGYASAMSPARTVITDNDRIVEAVGSQVDWVCTGTRSLDVAWLGAQGTSAFPSQVPVRRRPFSRPAKTWRLTREDYLVPDYANGTLEVPTDDDDLLVPYPGTGVGPGNYLIVDTGNNRVVEVDRTGRQVWPLDTFTANFENLANFQPGPTPMPVPVPVLTSRRPGRFNTDTGNYETGDQMGFDLWTSPTNTTIELDGPTDAHRYMEYDETNDNWEMHTVIADSGNFRVLDITTTFAYDPDTGATSQSHGAEVVTPTHIWRPDGRRRGEYVQVAYTKAIPVRDPSNGIVMGYLCAASNLHQLVAIARRDYDAVDDDYLATPTAFQVNPTGDEWVMWQWLYDEDDDPDTTDRLIFENIRHVGLTRTTDEYGALYDYLMVVCGRYNGPLDEPTPLTFGGLEAGETCVEFRLTDAGLVANATGSWFLPYWYYTDRHYEVGPIGHVYPEGAAEPATQAFYPSCAQRLPAGRHMVSNYASTVIDLTHENVPTATDFGTPPSLGAIVFEVETRYETVDDPYQQVHIIDVHEAIPNPWGDLWTDPINQPSFVHRIQESLPAPVQ